MVWPPLWATGRRSVKKEVILQFSKNLVSEKGVRRHTINSLPSVCELKAYLCLIIICVLPQKEQKGAMHSVKGRWQWAVFPDAGRAAHWWTSWKMRGREALGWRRQRWNLKKHHNSCAVQECGVSGYIVFSIIFRASKRGRKGCDPALVVLYCIVVLEKDSLQCSALQCGSGGNPI